MISICREENGLAGNGQKWTYGHWSGSYSNSVEKEKADGYADGEKKLAPGHKSKPQNHYV